MNKINWEENDGTWFGTKQYPTGKNGDIYMYDIIPTGKENCYIVRATNNVVGGYRIGVKNINFNIHNYKNCEIVFKYKNLETLKRKIENGKMLWCDAMFYKNIGKVTYEEY